ncbi:MAG: DUF309 domain-containing protein [Desulfobacteraceae bacterium]|nr:DUF309 domain-containing protein [Desulfobacteraceae bacterium]
MTFDPFENRLCRDIRNTLGAGFIKAIQANNIKSFYSTIKPYQLKKTKNHINSYVHHRINCLKNTFDLMTRHHIQPDDFFSISIVLWNFELFFEFHEWMEKKWLTAHGNNKKAFQALILSAIVYEQLLYGRIIPAKKVAAKALMLFDQYKSHVPKPFNADLLISKLTELDAPAPKFDVPCSF